MREGIRSIYYKVERQARPGSPWKPVTSEGMGGLEYCKQIYRETKAFMKRGSLRLIGTDGHIVSQYTVPKVLPFTREDP